MNLSVLLLLSALLILGSAAPKDLEKKNQTEEVIHLNLDLEDEVPELTANGSLLAVLTPPDSGEQKAAQPRSFNQQSSTLKWETVQGAIPTGAVRIYNSYTERIDYVCKYGCSAGFFSPTLGPQCRYPLRGKEQLGYPFEILVNKDNFENLGWSAGSQGQVPQNSVKTCHESDLYVGMNIYGLGKVQVSHKSFYLPWRGKVYKYSGYDVLTINKNIHRESVFNVRYNISVKVTEHLPETMSESTITNNECDSVDKDIVLSRTYQEEERWDTSIATTIGVTASITAQIPVIRPTGVSLTAQITQPFSSGDTIIKSSDRSINIKQTIPPKHSCRVSMVGHRYEAEIPFTARLSRTYRNGRITTTSISGSYTGVNMGMINSVVDECEPIPGAGRCN